MNENSSIKVIGKKNLTEQRKLRLSEITGTEKFLYQETNERELNIKKLNKCITIFGYIDKILIILNATSRGVSIISFTSFFGAPVGITSASFTLIFSIAKGIIKIFSKITRNKKKKYDKIVMLTN